MISYIVDFTITFSMQVTCLYNGACWLIRNFMFRFMELPSSVILSKCKVLQISSTIKNAEFCHSFACSTSYPIVAE